MHDTAQLTVAQRFRIVRAQSRRLLARSFDEDQHPRDEHGRWTDSGGGGDSSSAGAAPKTTQGKGASDKAFAKIKAAVAAIPPSHAAKVAHVPVVLAESSDDFPSHIGAGGGASTVGLFGWANNQPRIDIAENIKGSYTIGSPGGAVETKEMSMPVRQPEQVTVHELAHAFDYVNDWAPSADAGLNQSFTDAVKQMTPAEAKNANYWISGGQREMFAELYSAIHNPNRGGDQTYFGGMTHQRVQDIFAPAIAHILQIKRFDVVRRAPVKPTDVKTGWFVNESGELYALLNGMPYAVDVSGTPFADVHLASGTYADDAALSAAANTAQKLLQTQWRLTRAQAERFLKEWDESKHPRVPAGGPDGGQFGEGGGGADAPDITDAQLDPKVIAVGGDAWNKATARRLEREYQQAKPKLEEMLGKLDKPKSDDPLAALEPFATPADQVPTPPEPTEDEEEEPIYVPESWEEMSGDDQQQAEEEYYSQKLDEYVESEKENWEQNGGALDEAKAVLANDDDFIHEAIKDYIEGEDEDGNKNTDTKFPYDVDDLANAITLDYASDGEGNGDLTVNFNDAALKRPIGAPPEEQGTLPGIEPEDLSKRLTEKMREELTKAIEEAFDEKAKDKESDMEAPDYLADNAKEFMEENWQHSMTDEDKFGFAKHSTSIINDAAEAAGVDSAATSSDESDESVTGVPNKFDPLNETSGADYRKTQKVARLISVRRAQQVLTERKLPDPGFASMRRIDSRLWSAWKSSSTSEDGQLLQVATADELGGRLNPQTGHGGKVKLDKDRLEFYGDVEFKSIGGYAGVKAYLRAKWETTQFLLDKAGISELELYRGIALDPDKHAQAIKEKMIAAKQMVDTFSKVPNLTVVRNGAASTTTNPSVANGWANDGTRVVLRALLPRTAAVSIPAYGINVKSEQEVVVAGTAWKAWDAWLGQAPTFNRVAMVA